MRKLAIVTLISFSSLFGFNQICPGDVTVQGEYLFLKPGIGDTWFATTNTVSVANEVLTAAPLVAESGTLVNNDLEFSSGFRVGAFYALCECPVEIRGLYTRLTSSRQTSLSPQDGLFPSQFYPYHLTANPDADLETTTLLTSSSINLTYQRGDALLAHEVYSRPCEMWINAYGGFEVVQIDLQENYLSTFQEGGGDGPNTYKPDFAQDFFAIGPEVGFESKYKPCWPWPCSRFFPDCLAFVSNGSFSLLAARSEPSSTIFRTVDTTESAGSISSSLDNDSTWRVSWAAHLQLGVTVERAIACVHSVLEVGYEFDFYSQALDRNNYFHPGGYVPSTSQDFSLQGLYVSGKISF
jgi:hypothetical protein